MSNLRRVGRRRLEILAKVPDGRVEVAELALALGEPKRGGRVELLAAEHRTPPDHLVEHHADRVDVGSRRDGLCRDLLRGHVCGRSQDLGLRRLVLRVSVGWDLRDAEVDELDRGRVVRAGRNRLDEDDVVWLRSR